MAKTTELEHIQTLKKQGGFLVGSRVRDRKKMLEASRNIDKLRRKVSGPDSVEIIRKFRGPLK